MSNSKVESVHMDIPSLVPFQGRSPALSAEELVASELL